jgi:group II intron reverse transcriptase/maturase
MEECEMQSTENIIHVMQTLGEKQAPLTRVYRQLYNEQLYVSAYSRLYRNDGALTPGVTSETVDGMSLNKVRGIIEQLRTETYRWSPVQRRYIRRKDGRKRPLGLPTWRDKLVEEVIRIILSAYYEPIFSDHSHGYRPERGCHTALQQIVSHWTGTVWFIEGDIRGCFDNIDHDKLMMILSRRIKDNRLLRLIRHRLESGIMEDWQYQSTYSGTPQGSVLSPLLANIYLHELDEFIESELLPEWNKGNKRRLNAEYRAVVFQRRQARKKDDHDRYKSMTKAMRQLPSQDMFDPEFRRLKYVRYADDFLLGFIGTKAEAQVILQRIEVFLSEELNFSVSPDKSRVTHAKTEMAHFLGYGIGTYSNVADKITGIRRSANGRIALRLPEGFVEAKSREWEKGGKPRIDGKAINYSVEEALTYYQSRYRGIVNYYQYAVDLHELARLKYAMERSLVHTLSAKLKISVSKVYNRYRDNITVDGQSYKVLRSIIKDDKNGKTYVFTWGGIPLKRRYIVNTPLNDRIHRGYQGSSELVARLRARQCDLCGIETQELEGHHVHRIKDLDKKYRGKHIPYWVFVMTARRRKTLFVCRQCHHQIHSQR